MSLMKSQDNIIPITRARRNPNLLRFAVTAGRTRVDGAIGIRPTQPPRDKPAIVVELAKTRSTESCVAPQISDQQLGDEQR